MVQSHGASSTARLEVGGGGVGVALAVEPGGQAALGQGQLLLGRCGARAASSAVGGQLAVVDPAAEGLVVGPGVDLGEVPELVVARGDGRRLGDPAVLVDPHHAGTLVIP